MSISINSRLQENFQQYDGIFFPKDYELLSAAEQKQLWDKIGSIYYQTQKAEELSQDVLKTIDYQQITGKIGGLWNRFPHDRHFETILEIGCGYGRTSINLSKEKNLSCAQYYGIDISEPLLRRLLYFKQAYNFYPSATFNLICNSAETLPLADNSADLIISNAVLMHIEQEKVEALLLEVARVLKPGGAFVFNNSFHNRNCPGHILRNLSRKVFPFRANSIYLNQQTLEEVESLLENAGIAKKCSKLVVEPNSHYVLLPEELGGFKVPLANGINRSLKPSTAQKATLAYSFNAYSAGVLDA